VPGPGGRDFRQGTVGIGVEATRTILQFSHRVEGGRGIDLLVRIRPEVGCMAARTVRLVAGGRPGGDLGVRGVATLARHRRCVRPVKRRNVGVR
jgi:hypothetical protein